MAYKKDKTDLENAILTGCSITACIILFPLFFIMIVVDLVTKNITKEIESINRKIVTFVGKSSKNPYWLKNSNPYWYKKYNFFNKNIRKIEVSSDFIENRLDEYSLTNDKYYYCLSENNRWVSDFFQDVEINNNYGVLVSKQNLRSLGLEPYEMFIISDYDTHTYLSIGKILVEENKTILVWSNKVCNAVRFSSKQEAQLKAKDILRVGQRFMIKKLDPPLFKLQQKRGFNKFWSD